MAGGGKKRIANSMPSVNLPSLYLFLSLSLDICRSLSLSLSVPTGPISYRRIPAVHSCVCFALVNPARRKPSAIGADNGLYHDTYRQCHRDHRRIFAMHHERRAVRRPNEYPALSHFRSVFVVYLVRQPPTWSEITRSSGTPLDARAVMQSSEQSKRQRAAGEYWARREGTTE